MQIIHVVSKNSKEKPNKPKIKEINNAVNGAISPEGKGR